MATLLEIEIWGTVVHCLGRGRLARNTDNATHFALAAEISVFLLPRCGNDPPLAQILFAPLRARAAGLPVRSPVSEWATALSCR